jgi:hypothetical protein
VKNNFINVTRSLDPESRTAIYEGLTLSQCVILFEMDLPTLSKAIEGRVMPCGTRNGFPIYKVKEIIPWVVKPAYNVEERLRAMNPAELPKMLSKEFWAGQRAKQEFMLRNGDLWPTAKVVEEVGELMKVVKMSAQLAADAVERQVELSDQQRAIIKAQMDGMLEDLHSRIQERFKERGNGISQETDDEEL